MTMEASMDILHEMRFSVIARAYRDQENALGIADMSFDERFSMLIDAEWDSRRVNRRTRLLRAAGFCAPEANVADVRYDSDRKLDRAKLLELSNSSWVKDRRNVIITGSTGAGKTWIACALGVTACNAFYSVKYIRLPEMMDELTVATGEEWAKTKKRYIKCDLLIIDDWLLDPLNTKETREVLEVVEVRYRQGSLLLCLQFSPASWHAKLGEGVVADAVTAR